MKAMILAAGLGTRLKPLTNRCPKPLVKVNGKPLIEYHIENLSQAGIKEIVVNICYLGHLIQEYLEDGRRWGVSIQYSKEVTPLEVGGGVCQALPLLGDAPFIVVNADIWTDYSFARLTKKNNSLAHVILVANPPNRMSGDFSLNTQKKVIAKNVMQSYTYTGIAVLTPKLFLGCQRGQVYYLKMLLDRAIEQQCVTGELYPGIWTDVGTLDRLYSLEKMLQKAAQWRE